MAHLCAEPCGFVRRVAATELTQVSRSVETEERLCVCVTQSYSGVISLL